MITENITEPPTSKSESQSMSSSNPSVTVKPLTAMDRNMCGSSLIERPLKHAPIPDIMRKMFEMYEANYLLTKSKY